MSLLRKLALAVAMGLKKAGPWVLIFLPAVLLNRMIQEHKVNIPFLDDWMFFRMDAKAAAGELGWRDFFVAQMEHRMAFVRAVIMMFHWLWPGEYTRQMWLTWFLLVCTCVNVGVLLRQTVGEPFRKWWPLLALASLAIFSPVQYRLVLWAMMFQVACPAFFLSAGMVVLLQKRWPSWLRFLMAMLCAQCATQSFATGILIWVLLMPMIWWSEALSPGRERRWFMVAWVAVFMVTMGLYFVGLKNEVDPQFSYKQGEEETMGRNVREFTRRPMASVVFVFRFLGCHLARGSHLSLMDTSLWIGLGSVGIFVLCGVYWLRRFRDQVLRDRLFPWLLFGAYSIGAAALTALGRAWATTSGDNAVHSRYVIHAVPLTVSVAILIWIVARDWRQRHPGAQRHVLKALTAGAFTLVFLQGMSWTFGWRMMEVWQSSRLRGAANTMFFKALPQAEGDVAGNRSFALLADDHGLLKPAMLTTRRLDSFGLSPNLLSGHTAEFSACAIVPSEEGVVATVRGFACLPARQRVADAILLTYKDSADGHWEIFHVTQVKGLPLYFHEVLSRDLQFTHVPEGGLPQQGLAGFAGTFSLTQLPPGEHRIMAWALDYRSQRVFPMRGYFLVDGAKGRVKKLGTDPKSVKLDGFIERGKSGRSSKQSE